MIRFLIFIFVLFFSINLQGQNATGEDSIHVAKDSTPLIQEHRDTVLLKSYATRYDPRKALLYAAILPGLGQIYTKKYWKVPLVYGGMAITGYAINLYQKGYTKYKLELFTVLDGTTTRSPSGFDEATLRSIVNSYRRQRDFMIIIMGGVYLLQIIDAHVDAHLKEFDLNPNLQVSIEPMIDNDQVLGRQGGFSIYLKF